MRVLAIGNAYPPNLLGGYEIAWQGVTRHLREQGHAARILTTAYRAPEVGADAAEDPEVYRQLRWYWRDHEWPPMGPRQRLALERHNARLFDRHVQEFQPDVVTWWPMGGMSLSLIERARRAGLPAVLFVHDYWPSYGPERDLWTRAWARRPVAARVAERLTRVPTRYDLSSAGRWLFNAECVREQTLASGIRPADSDVLPPGVQEAYLKAGPDQNPPEWRWRLVYLGRVVKPKGVHTAIEALSALPPAATLRIVGDGDDEYRRELRELAERTGVAERVRFEPSRYGAELVRTYREADAVIFPVEWLEPWGLVPLEAMALGRPVLATGRGGSGDYLRHEVNSLLFAAGEPASLSAALVRLAGDPDLRSRLRSGGLQTAARHSERNFNQRALGEIESVIGLKNQRPKANAATRDRHKPE
jgi:glycogen synthase